MWRFCAGLGSRAVSGEPSSGLTLAHTWHPTLSPSPAQSHHQVGGKPAQRQSSACPESPGMPAREPWASGELCFLTSEALQSPGCQQETGGQRSSRLGTTAGAACQLQEPLLWQRRGREWQSCLVAAPRQALGVWSMAAEGRGRGPCTTKPSRDGQSDSGSLRTYLRLKIDHGVLCCQGRYFLTYHHLLTYRKSRRNATSKRTESLAHP